MMAVLTQALLLTPNAALAATSGTVDAGMTVTYSCDITFPATATLTPSGASATGQSSAVYEQNNDTEYDLSALTITGPAGTNLSGSITFKEGKGVSVVSNTSEVTAAQGTITGIDAGTGTLDFSLAEGVEAAFPAGAYTISATLSCAQAP